MLYINHFFITSWSFNHENYNNLEKEFRYKYLPEILLIIFYLAFINISKREILKKFLSLDISANNLSNFYTLYELAVTAIFPTSQNLCRLFVCLSVRLCVSMVCTVDAKLHYTRARHHAVKANLNVIHKIALYLISIPNHN